MNLLCSLGLSLPSLGLFLERSLWEPLSPPGLCSPHTYSPAPWSDPRLPHGLLPWNGMPFSRAFLWLTKLKLRALLWEASGRQVRCGTPSPTSVK